MEFVSESREFPSTSRKEVVEKEEGRVRDWVSEASPPFRVVNVKGLGGEDNNIATLIIADGRLSLMNNPGRRKHKVAEK